MRTLKLTDPELETEVGVTKFSIGRERTLIFFCPVCRDHHHVVPYRPGNKHGSEAGRHYWANPEGGTIQDLSLHPSYLAKSRRYDEATDQWQECRLHVFIRNGEMRILNDSGLTPCADPTTPAEE
jgi:hypothetical protein